MPLTILLVEDNKIVADVLRDLLTEEGWRIEVCADGDTALNRLAGGITYDLLLFDNELPGATGLELTRYARGVARYGATPIIMLSATDCGAEARRAGADLFLSKPDGMRTLVESIRRLIESARASELKSEY
jgi:CheY-like chemotaxis protein